MNLTELLAEAIEEVEKLGTFAEWLDDEEASPTPDEETN